MSNKSVVVFLQILISYKYLNKHVSTGYKHLYSLTYQSIYLVGLHWQLAIQRAIQRRSLCYRGLLHQRMKSRTASSIQLGLQYFINVIRAQVATILEWELLTVGSRTIASKELLHLWAMHPQLSAYDKQSDRKGQMGAVYHRPKYHDAGLKARTPINTKTTNQWLTCRLYSQPMQANN